MTRLSDFQEPGPENDRVVQMALREIDASLLSKAMTGWSEAERGIIYRNMSERARGLLREEVEECARTTSDTESSDAIEFFVQKLILYRKHSRTAESPAKGRPKLDTSSAEAIAASFTEICRFARIRGFIELEGIEDDTDHPLARKGMELAIDGLDPMFVRSVLERGKRTYLSRVERELDMIIDGVDNLISGSSWIEVHEILGAYIDR